MKRNEENFTVASWLLPRHLIPHFESIYAYCRWSDDLADETPQGETALSLLDWWQQELEACYRGSAWHPVMVALQQTIHKYGIPIDPLAQLLVAFRQDQTVTRYETFEQLLAYCQSSANPVGRLVLYLFECHDARRVAWSDDICTGLQLANFWQDVARDATLGRRYLPAEDCRRFQYAESDWDQRRFTTAFAELMQFQTRRTREYFQRGRALLPLIPRRLRFAVDLFIRGGEATLDATEAIGFNVWATRPTVSRRRKLFLTLQALAASFG